MIEEIRIQNLKAFRAVGLPLGRLTLLTGLNGSGKSTALQALGALRQSHETGALATDGLQLNGRFVEWGTGQDVLHEDYADTGADEPEVSIALRSESSESTWTFGYETAADLLRLSRPTPLPGGPGDAFLNSHFEFVRADRIVPAVHYARSHEMVVRQSSLGARGEYAADFLREFGDRQISDVVKRDPGGRANLLDQCSDWLGDLCPGVRLSADSLEGTDLVRLGYSFYGTAGLTSSNTYRPTNVGFGLTYVLPVVLACLNGVPGATTLLENPEAHIHPRGQALLGRLCAQSAATGAQIIVESHSDHVLNGIRLAVKEGILSGNDVSILYFSRSAAGVEVTRPRLSDDGMLSDWPAGFFDEWELSLERLLS